MSEPKSSASCTVPVWGSFLLFLGTVFLLQTFRVLPWGLWGRLWHFWPVIVIAFGICLIFKNYHVLMTIAAVLVLLFASLGIALWQYQASPTGIIAMSYTEPLDNLNHANIKLDLTAGNFNTGYLPTDSPNLVEATGNIELRVSYRRSNRTGILGFTTEKVSRQFRDENKWGANFTTRIPLNMEIITAVGNSQFDLSRLAVPDLKLKVGVGNYAVILPSSGGTRAAIESDVANLQITVPPGVAARIQTDINLAALEVDTNRFPRQGNYYQSPDYESAAHRIDLEIDCNLGRVGVR